MDEMGPSTRIAAGHVASTQIIEVTTPRATRSGLWVDVGGHDPAGK